MSEMTEHEYYPTRHAVEQMKARSLSWADVLEIVNEPEVTFGPDSRGRRVLQKGSLAVPVARDGAVITVLLRSQDQWTNEDVMNRKPSERQILDDFIWSTLLKLGTVPFRRIVLEVDKQFGTRPSRFRSSQIYQSLTEFIVKEKVGIITDRGGQSYYIVGVQKTNSVERETKSDLDDILETFIARKGNARYADIVEYLSDYHVGRFTSSDVDVSLRNLQSSGKIERMSINRKAYYTLKPLYTLGDLK